MPSPEQLLYNVARHYLQGYKTREDYIKACEASYDKAENDWLLDGIK